jgi:hypothetical protein
MHLHHNSHILEEWIDRLVLYSAKLFSPLVGRTFYGYHVLLLFILLLWFYYISLPKLCLYSCCTIKGLHFFIQLTVSLLQRALGTNKQSPLTSWRSYIVTSKRCSTETTTEFP